MKLLIASAFIMMTGTAFALPGPHLFAAAELKAIAEIQPFPVIGAGHYIVEKTSNNSFGGQSLYLIKSENPSGGKLCVAVTVTSQMAAPTGGARSSDEVIAEVKSTTQINCP